MQAATKPANTHRTDQQLLNTVAQAGDTETSVHSNNLVKFIDKIYENEKWRRKVRRILSAQACSEYSNPFACTMTAAFCDCLIPSPTTQLLNPCKT